MVLLAFNLFALAAFLAGLAMLLTILLRRSGRYFGRRKGGTIDALVRIPRPTKGGRFVTNLDSPEQIARFETQLHETMREISAQMDNKMILLQILLQKAEAAIARLERLAAGEVGEEGSSQTSAAGLGSNVELNPPDDLASEIYALADQGFSTATIAHRAAVSLRQVEEILQARAKA